MNVDDDLDGIIRARTINARCLVTALERCPSRYSERDLSKIWRALLAKEKDLLAFGWYQPPPQGISVLIGEPPHYSRLRYQSLRSEENWPDGQRMYSPESIIYPYFSAVDRATFMIGDHVGTYYAGGNKMIREWMSGAYAVTRSIVAKAQRGMTFSELFHLGSDLLKQAGARNNNFSIASGLAADLGHTIPFFGKPDLGRNLLRFHEGDEAFIVNAIGGGREFVGPKSQQVVEAPMAFTIEPQIIGEGLPMASFHIVVVFTPREKVIVEAFRNVFDHYLMSEWIYAALDEEAGVRVIA